MIKPVEKVLSWYFSRNALPYWGIIVLDFLILLLAGVVTYWIFIFRNTIEHNEFLLLKTLVILN